MGSALTVAGSTLLGYTTIASTQKLGKYFPYMYFQQWDLIHKLYRKVHFSFLKKTLAQGRQEKQVTEELGCTVRQEPSLVLEESLLLYNQVCHASNSQEWDKGFLLYPVWSSRFSANNDSFCFPVGSPKAFCQNLRENYSLNIYFTGKILLSTTLLGRIVCCSFIFLPGIWKEWFTQVNYLFILWVYTEDRKPKPETTTACLAKQSTYRWVFWWYPEAQMTQMTMVYFYLSSSLL